LLCPLGSHIRRTNPRDGLRNSIVNTKIHRVLRRGAAYGPVLPEGVLEDDGAERGIVFIFIGASLTRQFEFVQQMWINNGDFAGLGTEKDPLVGSNDGVSGFTIPARPIRRHLVGLPGFTQVRGGEYCLLPGLRAIWQLT
jgi:deferrochelatase/peroxidase EfeB